MVTTLMHTASRRWLATPLAVWGKLPSHADFLRHHVSAEQARDWQDWVTQVWSQRPRSVPAPRPRRFQRNRTDWLLLEPKPVLTDLVDVPVGFVMPPGALAFSPRHCVQGVLLASEDQVGRPCPLIIFQQLTPAWLQRSRSEKPEAAAHDMLFWLSRIAARTHALASPWQALTQAVDAIWQLHAPGWRQLLGASMDAPGRHQLELLLRQYCTDDSLDLARGLRGVRRLSQMRRSSRLLERGQATQVFWQQDPQGGYINSGASLQALWRIQP